MKYLVNFSGGACSFWAAHRTIERHGCENTVLLFADTLIESDDLYEFNSHAEQVLGVQITRICYGMDPWTLFRTEGLIGNNQYPICSVRLKREPLNQWMATRYELDSNQQNAFFESAAVVLGFDWTEEHRVRSMQLEHPTWRISAPMTQAPHWDKCRMLAKLKSMGFKYPSLYQDGFPHNNCGGFCVKAGISHFVHLYHKRPALYAHHENQELLTQQALKLRGIQDTFTILKDRRNNTTSPLSLLQLRQRIESNDPDLPKYDWGGCGCAGATK